MVVLVIRMHPEGKMNVRTKFHDPSKYVETFQLKKNVNVMVSLEEKSGDHQSH